MSPFARWSLVIALVASAVPSAFSQEKNAGKKITLFNGKNLDGWKVEGIAEFPSEKDKVKKLPIWSVKDGKIFCNGFRFGFLRYTKQQFGDFHFHVEYRMLGKKRNNSGIGIRTIPFDPKRSGQTRPSRACYEIQLLDDAGKQPNKHSTGSLYRYVAPKVNKVKPAPQWNVMDIVCVGPRIRVLMNGTEIIDFDQSKNPKLKKNPLKGYVCVQNHGSAIEFKNLWVREIRAAKVDSEKEKVARIQLRVLTTAIQAYFIKNNRFPKTLETLLAPDPKSGNQRYLEGKTAIQDPWGLTYQYDPVPTKGRTVPMIWTRSPSGRTISNYDNK